MSAGRPVGLLANAAKYGVPSASEELAGRLLPFLLIDMVLRLPTNGEVNRGATRIVAGVVGVLKGT